MSERTLAVIRKAAVDNYQVGHVRRHIEIAGFKIVAQRKIKVKGSEAEAFVAAIDAEGGQALVLEHESNAALIWQSLIPIIQRKDAEHLPADSLYGSSKETAAEEIGHLFPKMRPALESQEQIVSQDAKFANAPLVIFGEHEDRTIQQMHTCMAVGNVVGGVLCADGHVGYAQPVGGVTAYLRNASISGTGYDIGCGNGAVRTNALYGDIKGHLNKVLRDISRQISFGLGSANTKPYDHPLLEDIDAWKSADVETIDGRDMRMLAANQFLTCGTSNHYLDLFYEVPVDSRFGDDASLDINKCRVWIGVHFGSRGLGFKSATKYLKLAGGKETMFGPPCIVRTDSELGQRYLAAMELSGRYAHANREAVMDRVRRILGVRETDRVENHHNYSFLEEHNGEKLYIVRKGATPAFPGQRSFIGGSMGDDAVIVEGIDSEQSRAAFYSTIHGAGRIMSRTEAKNSFTRHQMEKWLHERGITLIGGDVDESPMAYRRLDDVLRFHENTIKVVHRLRPFAVMMASSDDRKHDPYHE